MNTNKAAGRQLRIYFRREAVSALQAEADRQGIRVEDLVKHRAQDSKWVEVQSILSGLSDRTERLEQTVMNLTERNQRLELILLRLCHLLEGNSVDVAYVRGAIEVQAQRSPDALKRAESLELRRSKMAQRVRDETNQYL